MKSAAVKSGYIMNAGNPLYYHEWGRIGAPNVLFVGPLRSAAYFWKPIAECLEDRFHCIALNLRGHGDSGPMLSPSTDVDLYVSDVAAAIRQLDIASSTVIAFAPMLAGAGVSFAAQHPDLLRSLVIIDAGPGLKPEFLPAVRARLSSIPSEFESWDEAVAYLREGLAPPVRALAQQRAPYVFRRTPEGPIIWKYDPVLRDEFTRSEPPPYIGAVSDGVWSKVRCPILFLVPQGGSVNLSLADCERLAKYGDESQWVEVPNCQHFIQEENPDGFVEALTPFLQRIHGTAKAATR